MPTIQIPIGTEIKTKKEKVINIQIPNSNFFIVGKKTKNLWEACLYNTKTRELRNLKRDKITTSEFSTIANMVLKTSLPYNGKEKDNITLARKFIRKLINKKQIKTWSQHQK